MTHIATSIDIDAPVQTVWDVATDLNRMGEWVSIHRDFPTPPPTDLKTGTRFTQRLAVAGTPFSVEWTASEVDGPRTLAWDGVGPAGTVARTTYSLTERDGGTVFTYENEFKLPGGEIGAAAGHVIAGSAEREANDSLARLKALAEA
jgi:uncharacterized protein YndB with AHSA1/START domain